MLVRLIMFLVVFTIIMLVRFNIIVVKLIIMLVRIIKVRFIAILISCTILILVRITVMLVRLIIMLSGSARICKCRKSSNTVYKLQNLENNWKK